jgi:hypothetical protein
MPSLLDLQTKIRLGYPLNPEEQAFLMKAADQSGVESERKWQGWSESPDSVVDQITE